MLEWLNWDNMIHVIWTVIKVLIIVLPLMGAVAYLTFVERKVISYIQARVGANRVGVVGLGQPIADALKLLCKEIIVPSAANRYFFIMAPILTLAPSLVAWSVMPFAPNWVLADIDAGVLFLFAMTALSGYGPLLAGSDTERERLTH